MNQTKNYSIIAIVELKFNDSNTRNNSYNSFLPEFRKLQTKRSSIKMEKKIPLPMGLLSLQPAAVRESRKSIITESATTSLPKKN